MAHDLGVVYLILCLVAGGISSLIFVLSLGLAYRRQQLPYLLIAVALGGLAARSGVAVGEIVGIISFHLHHTLEHTLDGVIAIALLGAIVSMGTPEERTGGDTFNERRS